MVNTQLGLNHLPPIQWLGHQRMHWDQLLLAAYEGLRTRHQPDVLVLHLGENDLGDVQQCSSSTI